MVAMMPSTEYVNVTLVRLSYVLCVAPPLKAISYRGAIFRGRIELSGLWGIKRGAEVYLPRS
jgi:hypothetical protein